MSIVLQMVCKILLDYYMPPPSPHPLLCLHRLHHTIRKLVAKRVLDASVEIGCSVVLGRHIDNTGVNVEEEETCYTIIPVNLLVVCLIS